MNADSSIASIFWAASLNTMDAEDKETGKVGSFGDLWPQGKKLRHCIQAFMDIDRKFLRKLAMFVARSGLWSVLQSLLDMETIRTSVRCAGGQSLLHLACILDDMEGVKLLLSRGADVSAMDDIGKLPVWYARDLDIIRLMSNVMKRQPLLMKRLKAEEQSSKSDGAAKKVNAKTETKRLFSLVKKTERRFSFEEIYMKLKALVPDVLTAVDSESGDNLLHASVRAGNPAVPFIVLLIERFKMDCNSVSGNGETPLTIAVEKGLTDIAELLIVCYGADVNCPRSDGLCPIHVACSVDSPETVALLLRRGAFLSSRKGVLADEVAGIGTDCLEHIEKAKKKRITELRKFAELVSEQTPDQELKGLNLLVGDLKLCDDEQNTLLMLPDVLLNQTFLTYALKSLNPKSEATRSAVLDARHPVTGQTAVSIASCLGKVEAVRGFLSAGADPTIPDNKNLLPVHHALGPRGNLAIVAAIFDSEKGLVGFEKSFELVADREEAMAVVREAFVRRQEKIVQPLLLETARRGSFEEAERILEPSDIVDAPDESGGESGDPMSHSPIFAAVQHGSVEVVGFFHKKGANLTREQGITGDSLLHVACSSADSAMVDYLLSLDQRRDFLEHINCSGLSALHIIVKKGLKAIVERLLAAGASPLLDEAAGFPPVSSPFQSTQLLLDNVRRERSSAVFATLKSCAATSRPPAAKSNVPQKRSVASSFLSSLSISFLKGASSASMSQPFANKSAYAKPNASPRGKTIQSNTILGHHRLSEESLASIQIYDFYLFDFNGEPLLTAAIRQKSLTLVEQLVQYYRQLADRFVYSALRRVVAFGAQEIPITGDNEALDSPETPNYFFSETQIPKRTELIHPCMLKSPRSGHTALHVAIQISDNRKLISTLANTCEASLCIRDKNGFTALQLAVALSRRRAVSELLKIATADLDSKTPDGRNLEQLAIRQRIIAKIREARQRKSKGGGDNGNNDRSKTILPGFEDDSLSPDEDEEDNRLSTADTGLSERQLRHLTNRLDFVAIIAKYDEISKSLSKAS